MDVEAGNPAWTRMRSMAHGNNILEAQSSRAAFEIWVHLVRVPLGARSSNLNLVHLSKYSLILCSKIAFWKMSPLCQTPSSNSHQVPTYLTFIKFTLKHYHQVHCACEIWAHFIQGLLFSNHDCVEFWYKSKSDVEEMIYDCQIIVDILIMVWEKHFGQLESFKLMSENFSDFVLDSVQLTSQ